MNTLVFSPKWIYVFIVFVTSGLLAISSSIPAVASQATLPSGDQLIALSCDTGPVLGMLNPSTGAVTSSGTTTVGSTCYHGGALNPITREIIALNWSGGANAYRKLYRLDATTGAQLGLYSFLLNGVALESLPGGTPGYVNDIMSFTFDDKGNLFLFIGRGGSGPTTMYFAAPTATANTFSLTQIGPNTLVASRSAVASFNPSDGKIYVIFDGSTSDSFYPLTLTYTGDTPTAVSVGAPITSECNWDCYGLAFDSAGTAWIQRTDNLLKTTVVSNQQPYFSQATVQITYYYSLIVVRPAPVVSSPGVQPNQTAPSLANTGSKGQYGLYIAIGFMLVGSSLLIRRKTSS